MYLVEQPQPLLLHESHMVWVTMMLRLDAMKTVNVGLGGSLTNPDCRCSDKAEESKAVIETPLKRHPKLSRMAVMVGVFVVAIVQFDIE